MRGRLGGAATPPPGRASRPHVELHTMPGFGRPFIHFKSEDVAARREQIDKFLADCLYLAGDIVESMATLLGPCPFLGPQPRQLPPDLHDLYTSPWRDRYHGAVMRAEE